MDKEKLLFLVKNYGWMPLSELADELGIPVAEVHYLYRNTTKEAIKKLSQQPVKTKKCKRIFVQEIERKIIKKALTAGQLQQALSILKYDPESALRYALITANKNNKTHETDETTRLV